MKIRIKYFEGATKLQKISKGNWIDVYANKDNTQTALQKLFDEVAPKYTERKGGYARLLKTGNRRGDNAPMAIVELV